MMASKGYDTFEEWIERLSQDPEYRKADRQIKPHYDLVLQIIKRRNELGMTQEQLAVKAGITKRLVAKLESANHNVRLDTLIRVAEALQTELQINLFRTAEPYKEDE